MMSCCSPFQTNAHFQWQTQTLPSDLHTFSAANAEPLAPAQEQIEALNQLISQGAELKLDHPREIYQIYEALNTVSAELAHKTDDVKNAWMRILENLHNYEVYRKGMGTTYLDTHFARTIVEIGVEEPRNNISATLIDLSVPENREEVIEYICKVDENAFGQCFQRGFLNNLLQSSDVRCTVARDQSNKIVGILWGFFTSDQRELFHFWELSREPTMAKMGIATQLIECAKQQQDLYPNLRFATLNVDSGNVHAEEIYNREQFARQELEEAGKNFMTRNLNSENYVPLDRNESSRIVRDFVMRSVPWYKLIWFEMIRKSTLCFRYLWYC